MEPNKFEFAKGSLGNLPRPAEGQRSYSYDSKTPGLAFCYHSSGKRSFVFVKKLNGKPKRWQLGAWPSAKEQQTKALADARMKASSYYVKVASGVDPEAEERAQREAADRAGITLRKLFDLYIAARRADAEK